MENFIQALKKNYIVTDGAMGTYYAQRYAAENDTAELANLSAPQRIMAIHREYIAAGAGLLRTNSFASHAEGLTGLPLHQAEHREAVLQHIYDNVYRAFKIAEEAARGYEKQAEGAGSAQTAGSGEMKAFAPEQPEHIWIAGDIGPIPAGGDIPEADITVQYRTMADALLDAGAQIILFETFADFEYILPTVDYIRKRQAGILKKECPCADLSDKNPSGAKMPVIMASFCLNKFGYTKSGIHAEKIVRTAAESGVIDVIGFNCGVGSTHMKNIIRRLDFGDMPVSIVPNSGYPDMIRDRNVYQDNIGYFCDNMLEIAGLGVNAVGGCCGTTPEYIRALCERMRAHFGGRTDMFGLRRHFARTDAAAGIDKSGNTFLNKLNAGKKVIAVELDPPHDGNAEKIVQASLLLKAAGADLITFSDSPMGKMRADSILSSISIAQQAEIAVMPHVCCRDKNVIAMGAAFFGAHMNGIRNMLVVTGDPVPAGDKNAVSSVYDFNSIRLMNYFKQLNSAHFADDPIVYGGALNYGRLNIDKEIERMRKKCAAGADYFLTQPIYSDADIERIAYIKTQIDTKILCGIMPLVSYRNAMFMKNEIYGIEVPDAVIGRYTPQMSREEGERTGIEIALEIAGKLKNIADGYYFMVPFNRASMICRIMERL